MPETLSDYISPAGARARLAQDVFSSDRAFNKMQKNLYDYNVDKAARVGKGAAIGGGGAMALWWLAKKFLLDMPTGGLTTFLDFAIPTAGSLYGAQRAESKVGPAPEIRSSDIKFGETALTETEMAQETQEQKYGDWSQFWDALTFTAKAKMMSKMFSGGGGGEDGDVTGAFAGLDGMLEQPADMQWVTENLDLIHTAGEHGVDYRKPKTAMDTLAWLATVYPFLTK